MSETLKFKFKELKVYASTEWLADGQKKYRRVFDRMETAYVYSEFSFYNKRFDEENWNAKIQIKVLNHLDVELGMIDASREIKSDQNIIYIREGWGNDEAGDFWKESSYKWQAYIDDVLVGTATFYVYDAGVVTVNDNKYMSIQGVKLYEGPDKGVALESREYYTTFNSKETKYIWGEMTAKNLLKDKAWQCEIFYYFYNDARQLKGKTVELVSVSEGQEIIMISSGWGSDHAGTWFLDNYTLEIVFMDTLIGIVPFQTGEEDVEGIAVLLQGNTPGLGVSSLMPAGEQEPQDLDEALAQLNELIGLESVKNRVKEYAQYLGFLRLRKEKGVDDQQPIGIHAVFKGNPGTGKTTVARLLGQIYKKLGLLTKGHVHEVDRADIVGEYIGQTAPKVKDAIKKARGGILFIDEAYSLARHGEDSKDYGKEVIEILVKEMSDGRGDLAIIVAGYPREMNTFLESNPGLKSRFSLEFIFPDYTPQELFAVAQLAAKKRFVNFAEGVEAALYQKLVSAFRKRDRSFGNARYVYSLVDEAKMEMGLRLIQQPDIAKLTHEELSAITVEDVHKVFEMQEGKKPDIPQDFGLLHEALEELKGMTGLEGVKLEVNELVKLVRFYQETGKDVLNKFSLHSVFLGNPGTGKTTVARIIGKIFKALGILERGELIETDRAGLVAGYTGQTAIKTDAIIESARGSVLFIDEAYSLSAGGGHDFGREAIETLLKRMEDMRGEMIVIVAGYPENMTEFLESNPGLKSRFDRKFVFADYQPKELYDIAIQMLKEEGITLDEGAIAYFQKYLAELHTRRNKYFGNGRAVRKVIEKAIRNQHLRLADMAPEARTITAMSQMIMEDLKEFDAQKDTMLEGGNQNRVGF